MIFDPKRHVCRAHTREDPETEMTEPVRELDDGCVKQTVQQHCHFCIVAIEPVLFPYPTRLQLGVKESFTRLFIRKLSTRESDNCGRIFFHEIKELTQWFQ